MGTPIKSSEPLSELRNLTGSVRPDELEQTFFSHEFFLEAQKTWGLSINSEEKNLFLQAMTHSSYGHEKQLKTYERLEFLGDAVLEILISNYLYKKLPEKSEGTLSKLRGSFVNSIDLATLSQWLKLPQVVLLGQGEVREKGQERPSIQADLFESFLGFLYLSRGHEETQKIFYRWMDQWTEEGLIDFGDERLISFDPKTKLQEMVLAKYKDLPRYQLLEENEKGHRVALYINQKFMGEVFHQSKKMATKILAAQALEELSRPEES